MFSFVYKAVLSVVVALTIAAGSFSPSTAKAETLLTVETSDNKSITFTREDLSALPRVSFKTSTIWTEGVKEFSGVPLKTILSNAGITTGAVRAVAVNDYIVEIPVDSLEDEYPILADQIDGKSFSRREKGPLWVVFPYDKAASYRTEENFGRSIWQLVKLSQK